MPAIETTFRPDDGKNLPCLKGHERTEYHEPASGLRLGVTRLGSRTWLVVFWSSTAARTRRLKTIANVVQARCERSARADHELYRAAKLAGRVEAAR